mmetsp:Transcript_21576/g.69472  ORF Transcript_21576/g.69472 Transcript_21576/m.69472 type:complete len:402 (-) Transcript_21576:37-1242(-)
MMRVACETPMKRRASSRSHLVLATAKRNVNMRLAMREKNIRFLVFFRCRQYPEKGLVRVSPRYWRPPRRPSSRGLNPTSALITSSTAGTAPESKLMKICMKKMMRNSVFSLSTGNASGAAAEPAPPAMVTGVHYRSTAAASSSTFSPGLNAGIPRYGQPAQRKASPFQQLPHELLLALAASSLAAPSSSARPHVQPLHGLRVGPHASAFSALATTSPASSASSSSSSSSSPSSVAISFHTLLESPPEAVDDEAAAGAAAAVAAAPCADGSATEAPTSKVGLVATTCSRPSSPAVALSSTSPATMMFIDSPSCASFGTTATARAPGVIVLAILAQSIDAASAATTTVPYLASPSRELASAALLTSTTAPPALADSTHVETSPVTDPTTRMCWPEVKGRASMG